MKIKIGKVNSYFFQFDNFCLQIIDLEVFGKGLKRSFARQQFGQVDWDGKLSGEIRNNIFLKKYPFRLDGGWKAFRLLV